MGSKAKILVSLNLLLYVLSPTGSDTTNSTSPVAPCPNNSSSTSGLTPPPSGGGTNVAPCPYNSSNVAPCPRDALKLGICVNLVGKTVAAEVGKPATIPCCTVLAGLADLEVAVCFCTAIRANILGNKLDVPISLNLLLNVCGITPPPAFICA